jgi:hypothetical protein
MKKKQHDDQGMFGFVEEMEDQAAAENLAQLREQNEKSMRCCWPEWEGPKVEDSIHGLCSVGQCCVFSETHNSTRYHYCAPCRIIEVTDTHVRAVINYPDSAPPHCVEMNGEILRLDRWQVWPPVDELLKLRHEEERREAEVACGTAIMSDHQRTP